MKTLKILILLVILIGGCGPGICDSSSPNYNPELCRDLLQQIQMQQQQMKIQQMQQDIWRLQMQSAFP